jgi:hypothetical protein
MEPVFYWRLKGQPIDQPKHRRCDAIPAQANGLGTRSRQSFASCSSIEPFFFAGDSKPAYRPTQAPKVRRNTSPGQRPGNPEQAVICKLFVHRALFLLETQSQPIDQPKHRRCDAMPAQADGLGWYNVGPSVLGQQRTLDTRGAAQNEMLIWTALMQQGTPLEAAEKLE